MVALFLGALMAVIFRLHHQAFPVLGIHWICRLPGISELLNGKGRSP